MSSYAGTRPWVSRGRVLVLRLFPFWLSYNFIFFFGFNDRTGLGEKANWGHPKLSCQL
ncbi:hypothetical protein BU24DRAFT_59371 [Aaosphaeria arxii CBS 175.79]|uniref:Uncharacterized protein n=1 Tax=Aaosphaeria arxii CBS 175.79 TaxID=1450172 RepID=A0A6A5XCE8_9PLEO|nr:uncharacterized protein BU24DRAFT_59371 [Aaosphaeria arxii CBS 175.79]KAF2010496.1 hypothetical protein BU24DRAFT_59371 [Aaosphaeria arxii CBS 175.79]